MRKNNIKNLPLYFRVDENRKIGAGHIMRCIALAQEWQNSGGDVIFISSCESHIIRNRIVDEGFEYIDIPKTLSEKKDIQNTILALNSSPLASWLVLDGYHFSNNFFKCIKKAGYDVLLFDDVNRDGIIDVDIILNQNIDAEKMKYNCNSETRKLLGVEYALLRKDFFDYRDRQRFIPEKATKVVVTLGGGDFENITLKIIKALNLLNDPKLDVIIIVGLSNIYMDSLICELSLSPFKNKLLVSVKNMPEIMAWADLAITAGGSTCWELCFMGVPSLVVCTAINQKHVVNGLDRRQIFQKLGWWEDLDITEVAFKMQKLIADKIQRTKMSLSGENLIDGFGVKRIIQSIIDYA